MRAILRQYLVTPLIAAVLLCGGLPLALAAYGQLGLLGVGGVLSAGSGLPAIISATTYYVCT